MAYNINVLRTMPRDKLVEISARKNANGNGTREALSAQKVLRERSGHWPGVSHKAPSFLSQHIREKGSDGFTKKFK